MPELCRIDGIVITMYWKDHPPPHFHARGGEHQASFDLDGTVLAGSLSRRDEQLVREWALRRGTELRTSWDLASRREHPGTIEP